jgi:hypothetical protein
MRRLFDDLRGEFPLPHLIVGRVETLAAIVSAEIEIGRLIEALWLKADWATGPVRDKIGPAIHCVFAQREDAQRFAVAVRARVIGRYPAFASQHEFRLDADARKAIANVLGAIRR